MPANPFVFSVLSVSEIAARCAPVFACPNQIAPLTSTLGLLKTPDLVWLFGIVGRSIAFLPRLNLVGWKASLSRKRS